ncbi:MAG: xanthine dehydrogenase family protein subunit M [Chloroflexi bacterium]|nr:xanthine dehydrogenase family protein subunit M [Chloroflexota bacterium]
MIPGMFDYFAPSTLEEATRLLEQHGPDAKLLAGGHSLIPLMKLRLAAPRVLVDLNGVAGLAGIEERDGHLRIGAMTRHAQLEASELISDRYPLIADAAAVIADPLVRNRGTIGGSLAHADPAGDLASVMTALRAELVVVGPRRERTIPIDDFLVGLFTTALEPNEVLSEVRVPSPNGGSGGAYVKLERKVGDFATVAIAVQLTVRDGTCDEAGIALTSVGPTNLRARQAEDSLRGGSLDEQSLRAAADLAAQEAQPAADLRGSEEYKRDMVRVLTLRALRRALERATR